VNTALSDNSNFAPNCSSAAEVTFLTSKFIVAEDGGVFTARCNDDVKTMRVE
jgi:hypothetical protein